MTVVVEAGFRLGNHSTFYIGPSTLFIVSSKFVFEFWLDQLYSEDLNVTQRVCRGHALREARRLLCRFVSRCLTGHPARQKEELAHAGSKDVLPVAMAFVVGARRLRSILVEYINMARLWLTGRPAARTTSSRAGQSTAGAGASELDTLSYVDGELFLHEATR